MKTKKKKHKREIHFTHYAIWPEMCILFALFRSSMNGFIKKNKIFSILRKIRNSRRIIMFLLFPVAAAVPYFFCFAHIAFELWITNQSFGYRHCTDARKLCQKTRSRMPFSSQTSSRINADQSIETACQKTIAAPSNPIRNSMGKFQDALFGANIAEHSHLPHPLN